MPLTTFSRRALAPLAGSAGSSADPEMVRRIESHHQAQAALDDAYTRHAEAEDDRLMEPYQEEAFRAEEALILAILGNPCPDAVYRPWRTRGVVHAGRLYLAIATDPDDEEREPGQLGGGTWVMGLRVVELGNVAGLG